MTVPPLTSASPEWYTPARYWMAASRVMDGIDLDPCADPDRKVDARMHYTAADNGLVHPWYGKVFMNPPYGRMTPLFVNKLLTEWEEGRVTDAVILVKGALETKWFQRLSAFARCEPNHRIQFDGPNGGRGGATFASVFVYLGWLQDTFVRIFSQFGFTRGKIG